LVDQARVSAEFFAALTERCATPPRRGPSQGESSWPTRRCSLFCEFWKIVQKARGLLQVPTDRRSASSTHRSRMHVARAGPAEPRSARRGTRDPGDLRRRRHDVHGRRHSRPAL